jgi:ankyrin repeat protein
MTENKISALPQLSHLFLLLIVVTFLGCNGGNKEKEKLPAANQEQVVQEQAEPSPSLLPAAGRGEFEKVNALLEKGANVNEKDADGRTALMYASFEGYNPVVKILLSHNANVNAQDINGRSALMFAASGPFPETVRILLENGATPDIQDKEEHFSALMFAAAEGQLKNIQILVEYGANPNLKDIDGEDALLFAQNNSHTAAAEYLKIFRE